METCKNADDLEDISYRHHFWSLELNSPDRAVVLVWVEWAWPTRFWVNLSLNQWNASFEAQIHPFGLPHFNQLPTALSQVSNQISMHFYPVHPWLCVQAVFDPVLISGELLRCIGSERSKENHWEILNRGARPGWANFGWANFGWTICHPFFIAIAKIGRHFPMIFFVASECLLIWPTHLKQFSAPLIKVNWRKLCWL